MCVCVCFAAKTELKQPKMITEKNTQVLLEWFIGTSTNASHDASKSKLFEPLDYPQCDEGEGRLPEILLASKISLDRRTLKFAGSLDARARHTVHRIASKLRLYHFRCILSNI